ncbi:MAG: hypothetical protein PHU25_20695 [Deltaproteobacteria bacterium]|nr:hypothetical protein [Deltaproteobacteria bacterium]
MKENTPEKIATRPLRPALLFLGLVAGFGVVIYCTYISLVDRPDPGKEMRSLVSDIKLAEQAYHATFGVWVCPDTPGWTPPGKPGSQKRDRPLLRTTADGWSKLSISYDKWTFYSYDCVCGARSDPEHRLAPFSSVPGADRIAAEGDWLACRIVEDYDEDGACSGVDYVAAGPDFFSGASVTYPLSEDPRWCPK